MSLVPQLPAAALPQEWHFGPFVLDLVAGRLWRDGVVVDLPPKPFALLHCLASRPGQLLSKDELLDGVWGHRFVSESVLKVAISSLRASLGEDARAPQFIDTVARRGYRFSAAVQVVGAAAAAAAAAGLSVRSASEGHQDAPDAAGFGSAPSLGLLPNAQGLARPAATPFETRSETPSTPTPPAPVLPGLVVAARTGLVGRADDLAQLVAGLRQHRLLTITGPGGVGKTRLALAGAFVERPADGVWLVRLDDLSAADQVSAAVARSLGLPAQAGRDETSLAQALQPLNLRLVLDNAEHLLPGLASQLSLWLKQAPGLQLLVTSQQPLHLPQEQVQALPWLDWPAPDASAALAAQSPAVELFVRQVQAAEPGWKPDDAAMLDAAAIARELDGLPLALQWAAARVPLLGVDGVRQHLDERLQMLSLGAAHAASAPARQRTLLDTLQWSLGLLPEPLVHLLQQLSVFSGGFTALAAQDIACGERWQVVNGLQTLREHALLYSVGESSRPRLRLLASVRSFGLHSLAQRGAEASTRAAHESWLLALFVAADERENTCAELDWLAPLSPEVDNLRAAVLHRLQQLESGPVADTVQVLSLASLLAASAVSCWRTGMGMAALAWCRRLQACGARHQADVGQWPLTLQARWHLAWARLGVAGQLLPPQEALQVSQQAVSLLQATGDHRRELRALSMLAHALMRSDSLPEREVVALRMHQIISEDSSLQERRLVANAEALNQRDRGDVEAYRDFWSDMLAQSRALGHQAESWRAAWGLGQALYLQGLDDAAIGLLDRAVDEMRSSGKLRSSAATAAQAVAFRLARDASPATLEKLREALQLLRSEGRVWWLADALPWVPLWQGDTTRARRLMAWADSLLQQRGEARGPVFARLRQAFDEKLPPLPDAPHGPLPATADEAIALCLQSPELH